MSNFQVRTKSTIYAILVINRINHLIMSYMNQQTKPIPRIFRESDSSKPKNMYVDKAEMLALIVTYQNNIKEAKENDLPEPVMSNELGKIILELATNMSKRYNFMNYSYTDMFISDSIVLGLHLAKTFDVNHPSANPYSYFSFSMFRVNAGIITREKKLLEGKYKYIAQLDLDTSAYQDHDNADDKHNNQYIEYLKEQVDISRSFQEKQEILAASEEKDITEELEMSEEDTSTIKRTLRASRHVELDF